MQLPDTYFEDEVRDGFYVPGMMKRAWAAQMEVLEDVAKVCEKHQIRWFADCGTLLGAVRHGGFIPWDDDIDICMLRDDLNRFLQVAKEELPDFYLVLNLHTEEEYTEPFTRIVNSHIITFDKGFLSKYHNFPFTAGIDIFPIDYVSSDSEKEEERKRIARYVQSMAHMIHEDNRNSPDMQDYIRTVEDLCKIRFDADKPIKKQLLILLEHLYSMFSSEQATEVVLMVYWLKNDSHKYPLELFEHTTMIPFETMMVPAPAAYDAVLRIEYGDYMHYVRTGGTHNYPYYRSQEDVLKEQTGIQVRPQYVYSEQDMVRAIPKKRETTKQKILDVITLILKAHKALPQLYAIHDMDGILQMLLDCQQSAIYIGDLLEDESIRKEPIDSLIQVLEQYCEVVYQLHQIISALTIEESIDTYHIDGDSVKNTDINVYITSMNQFMDEARQQVNEFLVERKEVVFLPYEASKWEAWDSIWRTEQQDEYTDVYVIPIPYYDKRLDGGIRAWHYEGDQFPEYVPITDYNAYDMEQHIPDVIYIQNPYDAYNYTISVHPYFYSDNLQKFTPKLVYIPYFTLEEIAINDQRGIQSLEYFCTVPGVVHADQVIVQSAKMRQTYIEALTKWAGDSTRHVWEGKILHLDSPGTNSRYTPDRGKRSIPQSWLQKLRQPDGSYKKVLLYYTGVSTFLSRDTKMLDKMESVFRICYQNQDNILLIWHPNPKTQEILETNHRQLWMRYAALRDKYLEEAWGIYDSSPVLDMKAWLPSIDAYYGDCSIWIAVCRRMGIPIMIQNPEIDVE